MFMAAEYTNIYQQTGPQALRNVSKFLIFICFFFNECLVCFAVEGCFAGSG
jgi:hypothetical protein